MAPIGNFALLCQGKVYTEDIADNASDLNYWRHIATQDFAAMPAAKENSTHTHTQCREMEQQHGSKTTVSGTLIFFGKQFRGDLINFN